MKITGVVKYLELEGGFFGIESTEGNYLPINLPEQLKYKDTEVVCSIEILDIMTMYSWGTPCKITSFCS